MTAASEPGAAPCTLPASLAGADWLVRAETQAVFKAIAEAGFSARIVGGAVRNALIGRAVADIDFATTAQPNAVVALATAAGLKAIPTGIDHGTITVVVGRVAHEVTTLREDVESFGRHARVAFTADWQADARRRDFTINALYCEADGSVFDPLDGLPDLRARRVRFIGNADERIREDYLRILRFFRFHAEYGHGEMDEDSLAACVREREGLGHLSGERVRAELMKLLVAAGGVATIGFMTTAGIGAIVLGVAPEVAALTRMAAFEQAHGERPDPVLRLAALLPSGTNIEDLKVKLRLSSLEAQRLHQANTLATQLDSRIDDTQGKVAIYRAGRAAFADAVMLAAARKPTAAAWPRLLRLVRGWQPPRLPVRGADLLARGVPPGPAIGRLLAAFEDWWVAEGFPSDPATIDVRLSHLISGVVT